MEAKVDSGPSSFANHIHLVWSTQDPTRYANGLLNRLERIDATVFRENVNVQLESGRPSCIVRMTMNAMREAALMNPASISPPHLNVDNDLFLGPGACDDRGAE